MNDVSTLVIGYENPDLDAYACAYAYAEMLSETMSSVRAGKSGQPLYEVEFVTKLLQAPFLPTYDPTDFEQIIVVDTNRPSNLDRRVEAEKVIEVIDHRPDAAMSDFPNAQWRIELVGAAATLIAEKYMERGFLPSQLSAAYLVAAIISNTLNFKGVVTTSRDRDAEKWLRRYAGLPDDFASLLFAAKSNLEGEKLKDQLIGDFSMMDPVNEMRVGIGQIEMVGAENILDGRLAEILDLLDGVASERSLDYVFTTLVDVDADKTYFVTGNARTKELLQESLGLHFSADVASMDRLILRKEYFMDLKKALRGR